MVVVMSEQQKIYLIPKLPNQGCRTKILESSRTYNEILQSIKHAYFDSSYVFDDNWTVSSIEQVVNQEFEKAYQEKRQELRSTLNSSAVGEQFAFAIVDSEEKVNDACKDGIFSGHEMLTSMSLGRRTDGVHVWLHADVPLQWATKNIMKAYLIIYKIMRGRAKLIKPAIHNETEPTPNFECHVSREPPKATSKFINVVNNTQIFIYEYDKECLPSKHPRHCYPYAVVSCVRANDLLPWKKSKVRKPRRNTKTDTLEKEESKPNEDEAAVADQLSQFIILDEYSCETSNPVTTKSKENENNLEPKKILRKSKSSTGSVKKVRFSTDSQIEGKENITKTVELRKKIAKQSEKKWPYDRKKPRCRRFRRRDLWRKNYRKINGVSSTKAAAVKDQDDFGLAAEYARLCNSELYEYHDEVVENKNLVNGNGDGYNEEYLTNQPTVQQESRDGSDFNDYSQGDETSTNTVSSSITVVKDVFEYNHSSTWPSNSVNDNNWDNYCQPGAISESYVEQEDQTLINDNLEVMDMEVSSPEPNVTIFSIDSSSMSNCENNISENASWNVECNIKNERSVYQDENGRLHVADGSQNELASGTSEVVNPIRKETMQSQTSQTVVEKKKRKHFHGKKLLTEHNPNENRNIPIETPEGCKQPADPRKNSYCAKIQIDFSVLNYSPTPKKSPKETETLQYIPTKLSLKEKELIKRDYDIYMLKKKRLALSKINPITSPTESKEEGADESSVENTLKPQSEYISANELSKDTKEKDSLSETKYKTPCKDNLLKESLSISVAVQTTSDLTDKTKASTMSQQNKASAVTNINGMSKRSEIDPQSIIEKCFKKNKNHLPKQIEIASKKIDGIIKNNDILNTARKGISKNTTTTTDTWELNRSEQDNSTKMTTTSHHHMDKQNTDSRDLEKTNKCSLDSEKKLEVNPSTSDTVPDKLTPSSSFKEELLLMWQKYMTTKKDNSGTKYVLEFLNFCGLEPNQNAVFYSGDDTSDFQEMNYKSAETVNKEMKEDSTAEDDCQLMPVSSDSNDMRELPKPDIEAIENYIAEMKEDHTFTSFLPNFNSESLKSASPTVDSYTENDTVVEQSLRDEQQPYCCIESSPAKPKPILITKCPVIDSVSDTMVISENSESYCESEAATVTDRLQEEQLVSQCWNTDNSMLDVRRNDASSIRLEESFNPEHCSNETVVEHKNKLINPFKRLPEDFQDMNRNYGDHATEISNSKKRTRCKKRNPPLKDKVMKKNDLRYEIESRKRRSSGAPSKSPVKRSKANNSKHELKDHSKHSTINKTDMEVYDNGINKTIERYRRASGGSREDISSNGCKDSNTRDFKRNEYSARNYGDYRNKEPYVDTTRRHKRERYQPRDDHPQDDHHRDVPSYESHDRSHRVYRRRGYHQKHYR